MAHALAAWLPKVIPCEPWFSRENIGAGGEWNPQLRNAIECSDAVIACLTPENLLSHWLHFECGAIACRSERNLLIPYAVGVKPSQLVPPINAFQVCEANAAGSEKLVQALVAHSKELGSGDFSHVKSQFEQNVPTLLTLLCEIGQQYGAGLIPPFRIPALIGLDARSLIDSMTTDLTLVGQNLQTLISSGFLNDVLELLKTRAGFRVQFVLAPLKYFDALTTSREDKHRYKAQYEDTLRHLRKLRTAAGDAVASRFAVFAHPGACSLSAVICDPSNLRRGIISFTPKWATDTSPDARISCLVRRSDNETLFRSLYGFVGYMMNHVYSLKVEHSAPEKQPT